MSCGQIALKELGIKVEKYYACEIDKHAIKNTLHNFPNTIQIGSVTDVKASDLERIDLIIGGSPCQGFSFAGKQLNFNDPRSALFFEFVRLVQEVKAINPNAKFLLENVNMKKEYLRVISEYLGVFPVRINSNLVSAQNRDRWYWTDIRTKETGLFAEKWTDIPQPKDRGILLKDVLEDELDDKYYLSDKAVEGLLNHKKRAEENGWGFGAALPEGNDKMNALKVGGKGKDDVVCVAMRIPEATSAGYIEVNPGECVDMEHPKSKTRRGRKMTDKSNCLMAKKTDFMQYTKDFKLRRLTPTECARLQTIPDWYEWIVSDTQQYKMLGNGWTVEVIKHIFQYL